MSGAFYQGELQGAPVAVWVPHQREATPWAALKAAADRLASLKAQHVVLPRAVCQDGSVVYNLMQASLHPSWLLAFEVAPGLAEPAKFPECSENR